MIQIINTSFIVGMCWIVVCNFVEDFIHEVNYNHLFINEKEYIIDKHGIDDYLSYQNTFLVKYDYF
jgi:hypothetical protein